MTDLMKGFCPRTTLRSIPNYFLPQIKRRFIAEDEPGAAPRLARKGVRTAPTSKIFPPLSSFLRTNDHWLQSVDSAIVEALQIGIRDRDSCLQRPQHKYQWEIR